MYISIYMCLYLFTDVSLIAEQGIIQGLVGAFGTKPPRILNLGCCSKVSSGTVQSELTLRTYNSEIATLCVKQPKFSDYNAETILCIYDVSRI